MALAPPASDQSPPIRSQLDHFTAPDGSRVTLDARNVDASGQWNCLFRAQVYGVRQPFTVCDRGSPERFAARMTDVAVHPHHDADVMLAYDTTLGESMAAWRGPWHGLLTGRTGPRPQVESYTRVFDALHLTDTRDGLLVRPRSARQVVFEPFTVFKEIPGIGDLRIQRPHEAEVSLPTWRGARARDGEIWRKPFTDEGEVPRARPEVLILATPTAVVELIPGPEDTEDSAEAADFVAGLAVSWSPA
ncbi:MAG: hypothetical protein GEU94_15875 [Micromonosporaceae bacterium]|nr:hypothetical protein [Micromonosporaceae bacterium]